MKAPAVNLLHLGSWGLVSLLCLACAATVTPPDTTPVYAEDATEGIEPIPVEYASVNAPEVQQIDGNASPCQKNSAGAPAPSAPVEESAPDDAKDARSKKSASEEKAPADNTDAVQQEAATDKSEKAPAAAPEPAKTPAAPQSPAQ